MAIEHWSAHRNMKISLKHSIECVYGLYHMIVCDATQAQKCMALVSMHVIERHDAMHNICDWEHLAYRGNIISFEVTCHGLSRVSWPKHLHSHQKEKT